MGLELFCAIALVVVGSTLIVNRKKSEDHEDLIVAIIMVVMGTVFTLLYL